MAFSSSDSIRILRIKESSIGVTPSSGVPSVLRLAGQSLIRGASSVQPEEIVPDRMLRQSTITSIEPSGELLTESSFGNSDDLKESALCSSWVPNGLAYYTAAPELPSLDLYMEVGYYYQQAIPEYLYGVTASNVITINADNVNFVVGHLVYVTNTASGNIVRRVTNVNESGTTSLITVDGSALTAETYGATSEIRVVGFQGTSSEFSAENAATAQSGSTNSLASTIVGGLSSATLDFTTLGLTPFTWIKVGGTGTSNRFSTEANNGWCRILEVTTSKIRFDRVPSGWTTDAGTGKTLKVWSGDYLKNGVTKVPFSIERCHTDLTNYEFYMFKGMVVDTFRWECTPSSIIKESFSLKGMTCLALNSSIMPGFGAYSDAPSNDVMDATNSMIEIREGSSPMSILQNLSLTIGNNFRYQRALAALGSIGLGTGDIDLSIEFTAYFESGDLVNRAQQSPETSISFICAGNSKAYVYDVPKAKLNGVEVQAGSRNTDATLSVRAVGLKHRPSQSVLIIGRFPYYET